METSLLFIVVVAINSVAVYIQRRYKTYTKLFGRYNWMAHVILLSVIWGAFLLGLVYLRPPEWQLPSWLHSVGLLVSIIGFLMVVMSWVRLGTIGTLNGRFFGKGQKKLLKGGLFSLRNPMYVGFALLFIAAAFWLGNAFYLWMAALSFVLLNMVQARIENP